MSAFIKKKPAELRSARCSRPRFARLRPPPRAMQMGLAPEDWVGKPVIAILKPGRSAGPATCTSRAGVDDVKRGILQAGGFRWSCRRCRCRRLPEPTTML